MYKMLYFFTLCKRINNMIYILRRQLIIVCNLNALSCRINEQRLVIYLIFLHYHNASSNRSPEEQVTRKLNDTIHIVIINQIFTDFLLGSTTIHNTRKAYDCSSTV